MLIFYLVTSALLILVFKAGTRLASPRRLPWVAVVLTALLIGGLILQVSWAGAMATLDSDPSRGGWWRPITSVLMQNGGPVGDLWNVVTLAVITALAEWYWGRLAAAALFLAGALVPTWLGLLAGGGHGSTDPRNWAGSSGATYFLGATLAGALLARTLLGQGRPVRTPLTRGVVESVLLALSGPALGVVAWFVQGNAHGLVVVEGFVLGLLLAAFVEHRRSRRSPAVPPTPDARRRTPEVLNFLRTS